MKRHVFETSMQKSGFNTAIDIWVNKPHVINKRIWSSIHICELASTISKRDLLEIHSLKQLNLKVPISTFEDVNKEDLKILTEEIFNIQLHEATNDGHNIVIKLVKIIPKTINLQDKTFFILVIQNIDGCIASFYNLYSPPSEHHILIDFPYSLSLQGSDFVLETAIDDAVDNKIAAWLLNVAVPQIIKWGEDTNIKKVGSMMSISLVDSEKYLKKYNMLKEKYGKSMVAIWPEGTDPQKYVYEDVAIATYLLLLWENDGSHVGEKQSFVDLGCGNGLLVYILASEGHKGYGIDVRKRHIWDMYPDFVQLMEKTITPSGSNLFPEIDWIIGNHSDELTPWIPVIAARSSYHCKFFLLPCCSYNFDGTKYQRRNSSKSQYMEYLDYVKEVCDACHIETCFDRLKIPSTKRICLVGSRRLYSITDHVKICEEIQSFINYGKSQKEEFFENGKENWITDFRPRSRVERVRNCTQVDKTVLNEIVKIVTDYLLRDFVDHLEWSPGTSVEINQLAKLLPSNLLNALKLECGGLQTLLKNNHHIFHVQSGVVKLTYPKTVDEVKNNSHKKKNNSKVTIKKNLCWFHENHPQGCPLKDHLCSYIHN